ncbi:hypothetical protein [Paenibacillus montanisoli]|uniref:YgiT-type zinc finger protein n=1 Tax=Paenibacillus montanisoli TaxID=2081970 RepID=A0A328U4Q1_9BACL|nr:hypothetical protein [Paenibacillus montanisoli]RAP75895.1 hypothetical protein DL346_10715 [Paenibacillus montanisoli]
MILVLVETVQLQNYMHTFISRPKVTCCLECHGLNKPVTNANFVIRDVTVQSIPLYACEDCGRKVIDAALFHAIEKVIHARGIVGEIMFSSLMKLDTTK